MTQVTLTNLVAKLSPELKRALEASAGAAMNQGVAAIEPEHWLLTLLNQQDTHLKTLIESQKINQDQLASELANRIERLPKVQDSQPTLSHA
ncbi:Clp protease N-terminal domain-containing protein, partial [Vibrio harveyi]